MNAKNTPENPQQTPESSPESAPATTLELQVEKLVTGGAGMARSDGQAIFVPLTAPGDRLSARIIKQRKGFAQAVIETVLEPGPGRREAPCQHFGLCGGCDLQHLEPDHQRQAKAEIVLDCFQRLGKLDVSEQLRGPAATGEDLGYRNRIRLYANPAGHYGLMRRGSHDVVPLDACPLLPAEFNDVILPWLRMLPPVEQIVLRLDGRGGWVISLFGPPNRQKLLRKILGALPDGEAPAPGCQGVLFNNLPIWGRDHLIHEVSGHKFKVSVQSFFQGNLAVTEEAIELARDWLGALKDNGNLGILLGDLFCGVGLFSLALADLFEQVVAVDNDSSACRDARNNVRRDVVAKDRVVVHEGILADVLASAEVATAAQWRESCCLIDPPRTGLGKEGVQALLNLAPRHLLYMSCDPATLARDTAALLAGGYSLRHLQVLEMFPQTAHIETLLLLEKQG